MGSSHPGKNARAAGAYDEVPETPEAALKLLQEGNLRFASGKSVSPDRDINRVREVAQQQKPFAAFLGCADSRVPIEIVFDQGFGDLFVTRIAGNVASSENIGSLEFGTQVLGAKVIYVLGHTNCGAVAATMKGDDVPGQISGLFQHIRPAVKTANGDLQKAIIDNVRNQAILLAESSPTNPAGISPFTPMVAVRGDGPPQQIVVQGELLPARAKSTNPTSNRTKHVPCSSCCR